MAKAAKARNEKLDDEEADADAPAAKAKRKLPIKLIVTVLGGLLVVGGGGAGAYLYFQPKPEKKEAAAPVVKPVAFIELPDVLVNLAGANSDRAQYLKVKVSLEVADQTMVPQINPLLPRVVDAFQTYLRELRPSDLEGSAGLYRLKEELTRRVNLAIEPARINAVLFKELIVQ